MIQRMVPLAAAGVLLIGNKLATDYTASRSVRFTAETSLDLETTSFVMERDGEPVEMPGGSGGSSSSTTRAVTWVDKVLEHDDGAPTKVQRKFGELKQKTAATFGENEMTDDLDGPLSDVTLELTLDDGKVEAKVVDGDEPSSEALAGHHLTLSLDAFLPDGDKDDGDAWDLDADQVKLGLGLDLVAALFPPKPEEAPSGGGEGGRGGRRPRGGSSGAALLTSAEWEGKATLSDATEDYEGASCRVIKITLEASGALPEPSFGGSRGRAFGSEWTAAFESTYELKLEGRLLVDTAAHLPVHLLLEGSAKLEMLRESERDGTTFRMQSTQEGELEFEASVAVEKE